MQSIEWIDKAKNSAGIDSDRQLALRLGITAGALSHHRNGRRHTLEDNQCLAIAELCGIDPAIVIADQLAERATSPAARKIYLRLGKLATAAANGVAAGVLATICLALPNKSDANQIVSESDARYDVYYVK